MENFNDNYDNLDEDRFNYESRPSTNDFDVFRHRNDPEPLIEEFYLYLTNKVKNTDPETFASKPYLQIKGTKPLLNPQGVRDLVQTMRSNINSHSVQTNLSGESLNRFMRYNSEEIWTFIVDSMDAWDLEERYALGICKMLTNKIELFLRRGLDDKEREHYSIEQKHEYSTKSGDEKKKRALALPNAVTNMFKN